MKKYTITVNDVVYHVTLEGESALPAAPYTKPHTAHAAVVPPPQTKAAPVPAAKTVGTPPPVENAPAMDASADERITAPMPGTILAVNIASGSEVKCGQVLMTLEAMKMENEIMAPADGRVVSVHVENGTAVESGTLLCVIQ